MDGILQNLVSYIGPAAERSIHASKTTVSEPKDGQTGEESGGPIVVGGFGYGVLVFSKGRPTQLSLLLRSIDEFLVSPPPAIVQVIYLDDGCAAGYECVRARHSGVRFVRETNFEDDLRHCLRENSKATLPSPIISSDGGSNAGAVLFCVDDLIFFRQVAMGVIMSQLLNLGSSGSGIFGVHMKLHPGIVFSHPASSPCHPPKCEGYIESNGDVLPLLRFAYQEGKLDWSYRFDLCAGMYRCADVQRVLDEAKGRNMRVSNPNLFEVIGNQLFSGLFGAEYRHGLCLSHSCCSVVTINKVQTEFDSVPIYSNSEQGDLRSINQMIGMETQGSAKLEVDYSQYMYSLQHALSVHVGRLLLRAGDEEDNIDSTKGMHNEMPYVSVLLPVHNGCPFLIDALRSVVAQTGLPFELLMVDDGSSDESVRCTVQIAQEFDVTCTIDEEVVHERLSSSASIDTSCVAVVVIRLGERRGLVAALDCGLRRARGDFIARMDADDICLPNRLCAQYNFMLRHPEIAVVGGQALSIGEDFGPPSASVRSPAELLHGIPTHPCVEAFELTNRCSVLHPTVMFRKAVVLEDIGGYQGAAEYIASELLRMSGGEGAALSAAEVAVTEDYALWAAISMKYPFSIASLPDVVLLLRSRVASKSRTDARSGKALTAAAAIRSSLTSYYTRPSPEYRVGLAASDESVLNNRRGIDLLSQLQQMQAIYNRIRESYITQVKRSCTSDIDKEELDIVISVLRASRDKALRKACASSFAAAQGRPQEVDAFLVDCGASFALGGVLKERILASLGAFT